MHIKPLILLTASLTCLTGCASQPFPSPSTSLQPGMLTVHSANVPEVRGYSLNRVPALLESLAGQQLSSLDPALQGTVELSLRSGTDLQPVTLRGRGDEPLPPITWFVIDYRLKDSAGRDVSNGTMTATGPQPSSFNSIQLHEQSVVMEVAVKLRQMLAKTRS